MHPTVGQSRPRRQPAPKSPEEPLLSVTTEISQRGGTLTARSRCFSAYARYRNVVDGGKAFVIIRDDFSEFLYKGNSHLWMFMSDAISHVKTHCTCPQVIYSAQGWRKRLFV